MKTVITNYRYWLLTLIAAAGIIALVATPADDSSTLAYIGTMLLTKGIAVAAFALFARLFLLWQEKGVISELSDLCKEE